MSQTHNTSICSSCRAPPMSCRARRQTTHDGKSRESPWWVSSPSGVCSGIPSHINLNPYCVHVCSNYVWIIINREHPQLMLADIIVRGSSLPTGRPNSFRVRFSVGYQPACTLQCCIRWSHGLLLRTRTVSVCVQRLSRFSFYFILLYFSMQPSVLHPDTASTIDVVGRLFAMFAESFSVTT